MDLGMGEILLILIAALLIYGGRLPEVARALGRSIAELKRGLSETRDAVASSLDTGEEPRPQEMPREVRRVQAPHEAATEDITKDEPPAPRHEHPN